ncbi:peptidoglycan-binding protein [Streptomyces sp. NPDC056527]|uniref:peptidoglycan-binding domain-containing protein n=1 Tax=Streptomyces sp. NPDC056527 TaxID=3345853 RepID=UPI00367CD678
MSWRTKRIKLSACTVGALAAAMFAVSTTPAAASGTYSGLAYVYGTGVYTNDWGDEGVTDVNTNASSNATCLWQMILWANGYLASDIDGVFGTNTKNATAKYQDDTDYLTVDGSAGKATWSYAADYQIAYVSGSEAAGQTLNLRYDGTVNRFDMRRIGDGNYEFRDSRGNWRKAGYNYRTC